MKKLIHNLAFDFGASSGRLMLSTFDGNKIVLEELHRFANEPIKMNDRLFWDFPRIFNEIIVGLKKAAKRSIKPAGIAIDTWGVDYGLIDKEGHLISNPVCYRDERTLSVIDDIEKIVPKRAFYEQTGIQYMTINTVNQLYFDNTRRRGIIDNTEALLFMPDLFSYFLSGEKYTEYSIASTSQMIHANQRNWDSMIIDKLNIPRNILQDIVMPGTIVGKLKKNIADEVELTQIPIIAVGGHDTASAVCAAPLTSPNSAYLSCGTWSLLGIENDEPIINDMSFKYNFTNEGGVEGKIRFLKNITGLWILQQLKKKWSENQPDISYPYIIKAASDAKRRDFIIDPDNKRFVAPKNMVEEVKAYCKEHQGEAPETIGEIAMAVYNGITEKYKEEINGIEKVTGCTIDVLHMVGGGIQDELLCTLTAKKVGKKVIAGPVEASVTGNILMQLRALGYLDSLERCRQVVRDSFKLKEYNM